MRAPLLRLLRNSSTSGSPLQQSEIVTRAALAVPQCAQQRRCNDRFAPTRLPRAGRGTGQQASPRRGAFSGLKNNSARAPSSPPGASPPLRCVGDRCFGKKPSPSQGLQRLSRQAASIVPATAARQHRAVAALLPASDSTCRRTPPVATAAGQHLNNIWAALGSHSHCAHRAIREE